MTRYKRTQIELLLISGVRFLTGAGLICSLLLEIPLMVNHRVASMDNFATGYHLNLDEVHTLVVTEQ